MPFDKISNIGLVHRGIRVLYHGPEFADGKIPHDPNCFVPQSPSFGSDTFLPEKNRAR
jgi:hypothetical protein